MSRQAWCPPDAEAASENDSLHKGEASLGRHWLLLALAGPWLGCAYHRPNPGTRPPSDLPPELEQHYRPPGPLQGVRTETQAGEPLVEDLGDCLRILYRATLPDLAGNDHVVRFEHYRPKELDRPRPAVIVSEFLASRVPEFMARFFTDCGWHVLILKWPTDMLAPDKAGADLERTFRQIIIDSRACIDWLCEQPDVDATRLGSFGVSFGGIVNVVLVAVDRRPDGSPRLHCNSMAMIGEDLPSMLLETSEQRILQYLEERQALTGKSPEQIQDSFRQSLQTDPQHFARYVDPRTLLLFLARFDSCVPLPYGLRIYERLGKPALYIAPTAHYSFVLTHYPLHWLGNKLQHHFRRGFAETHTSSNLASDEERGADMPRGPTPQGR